MVTHKEALDMALEAYDKAPNGRSGMEAAIREFCEAKGLALVPKYPTDAMYEAARHSEGFEYYDDMIAAAPDPFGDVK